MKTGEVLVMAIFGCMVLGGLVLAVRQGQRMREQVVRYSADRGYPLITESDSRLEELLTEAFPDEIWRPSTVMLVEPYSPRAYLFRYDVSSRDRPSKSSRGTAVLAEHGGRRIDVPVVIFSRTPGAEALVDERVEAGSRDFRREYTVTCSDPRIATEVVNSDIETVLMEHRTEPGWYLSVAISAGAVVVSSFWAESEEEWDHLIDMGRSLGDAVSVR